MAIGLNPDPRILIPDSLIPESKGEETVVFEQPERIEQPPALKTGAICIVLKSEGIASVNPSHPELLALIDAGADVGHFSEAARASVAKGKPSFSYVLAVVKGQMRDAALLAKEALERPAAKPANQIETFAERDARNARSRWEEMTGQTHPDNIKKQPGYVIDCDRQPLEISHVNAH